MKGGKIIALLLCLMFVGLYMAWCSPKRTPDPAAAVPVGKSYSEKRADSVREAQIEAEARRLVDSELRKYNEEYEENASASLPDGMEIPRYESSRGGQIIRHVGYTVSYDADFKTPQWVAWTLTAGEAAGEEPRAKHFSPDPQVRGAKAYPADYTRSGYDRGHMAPAGDMKWSRQAMEESFYMTNVCPQNRNLNRGDWKDLEEAERSWAACYGAVSITAGPIYTSRNPDRIGAHRVAVPDAFFKVLLVNYPAAPKAYGFIFKNQAGSHPLRYYQLTVDEVEAATGMDFFPSLPDKVERRIEAARPALP